MKRFSYIQPFVVLGIFAALVSGCDRIKPLTTNTVDGWAILAEKDDYDGPDMPDMLVEYIDIIRMRETLENSGWESNHILDLREFDRESLQTGLDWLEGKADENDVVILYVSAHGNYLSDVVGWRGFFAKEWAQIASQRRLLLMDLCTAANFTNAVRNDPSPHLSIASTDSDEFGWRGLEEEGLPIIGTVFTYYFTIALNDPTTDTNGDGRVSVQEATQVAEVQQRAYFHNAVLVMPEFVEMFHALGVSPENDPTYPHVIVDDAIGQPLFLILDAYP